MRQNTNNAETTRSQSSASGKSRRGFASMDNERHKLVSSKGGKAPRVKTEERIGGRQRSGYEGF